MRLQAQRSNGCHRKPSFSTAPSASWHLDIELRGDAAFIGWDIVCLGRIASGERFERGRLRQRVAISRDGVPLFIERADLTGGRALLDSPVGLNGASIFGTFIAAAQTVTGCDTCACRDVAAQDGEGAVTRLPGCLLARYRGASTRVSARVLRRIVARGATAAHGPRARFSRASGTRDTNGLPMELTPREKDKLLIFTAALLAERRLARGLKLNYPEAVAYHQRGDHGRRARRRDRRRADELRHDAAHARAGDGWRAEMIPEIQVEATFPDGTKLVTVHHPIP